MAHVEVEQGAVEEEGDVGKERTPLPLVATREAQGPVAVPPLEEQPSSRIVIEELPVPTADLATMRVKLVTCSQTLYNLNMGRTVEY